MADPTDKMEVAGATIRIDFAADPAKQPTRAETDAFFDSIAEAIIEKANARFLDDNDVDMTGVSVTPG